MTNSKGRGGNSATITYKRPEELPGMKEAGGDDDDNDDDGGRGELQGQEEAKGKEEMLILRHALAVRQSL
jgi:hypothetical protein